MHFSQGWVQFGYRFSNDFVPFALILVALGASRLGRLWPVVLLVAAVDRGQLLGHDLGSDPWLVSASQRDSAGRRGSSAGPIRGGWHRPAELTARPLAAAAPRPRP